MQNHENKKKPISEHFRYVLYILLYIIACIRLWKGGLPYLIQLSRKRQIVPFSNGTGLLLNSRIINMSHKYWSAIDISNDIVYILIPNFKQFLVLGNITIALFIYKKAFERK